LVRIVSSCIHIVPGWPGRVEEDDMVTIVTDVRLRQGAEQEWDSIMRERLTAAKTQAGWIGGQLLRPDADGSQRIIVGTWRSREDWERWHDDPEFAETRRNLEGLAVDPGRHQWHEVVMDVRSAGGRGGAASAGQRGRQSTARKTSSELTR
jgi:heme-degrading monooxygenase HmoA